MKNAETRTTTLKAMLSSAAFVKGFTDYSKRSGWFPPDEAVEQWRYERGRLFAAWLESYGVELSTYRLRAGRWATHDSIRNYNIARAQNAVI